MSETEDIVRVGDPLPSISHVEKAEGPLCLRVRWAGGHRGGEDVIDIAPQIFTFRVYRPLRDNPALFSRVAVSADGSAIVWPGDRDLEISADVLEDLADDTMTSIRFGLFLREMNWTYDAAAAQLGISRRLVAYYAKEREVPRYIGLACERLRERASRDIASAGTGSQSAQARALCKE